MQKIVFCDLDKTLIFGNHLHSPKDLESLRKFRRSGNLLVYCTVRNKAEADSVIRQFSLPYDYLILNNGSRIEDAYGTELFSRTIPRQPVHQLVGQGKEGFCSLLDFFVLPDIIIAYKLLLLY